MALVMGEGAGAEVEKLIHSAARSSSQLWMTTINLGEVWYSVARKKSPVAADEALELVALSGIRIATGDWTLTYKLRDTSHGIECLMLTRSLPRSLIHVESNW
jgi:hypothetical protein